MLRFSKLPQDVVLRILLEAAQPPPLDVDGADACQAWEHSAALGTLIRLGGPLYEAATLAAMAIVEPNAVLAGLFAEGPARARHVQVLIFRPPSSASLGTVEEARRDYAAWAVPILMGMPDGRHLVLNAPWAAMDAMALALLRSRRWGEVSIVFPRRSIGGPATLEWAVRLAFQSVMKIAGRAATLNLHLHDDQLPLDSMRGVVMPGVRRLRMAGQPGRMAEVLRAAPNVTELAFAAAAETAPMLLRAAPSATLSRLIVLGRDYQPGAIDRFDRLDHIDLPISSAVTHDFVGLSVLPSQTRSLRLRVEGLDLLVAVHGVMAAALHPEASLGVVRLTSLVITTIKTAGALGASGRAVVAPLRAICRDRGVHFDFSAS